MKHECRFVTINTVAVSHPATRSVPPESELSIDATAVYGFKEGVARGCHPQKEGPLAAALGVSASLAARLT